MNENVTFLSISSRSKELEDRLAKDDRKRVIPNHSNTALIFALDPRLSGILAYDSFSLERRIAHAVPVPDDALIELPGPYPRRFEDADEMRLLMYLQSFYSDKFKLATLQEFIRGTIKDSAYHPICQWLATLEWDGLNRLDQWLTQVYGVPLDSYHKAVGARFLIAAVRRVRHPGCKFDQMIVLEGDQGIGKSSSLETLFGKAWFTDSIGDLSKKDAAIDLRGKWCAEFSEIDHLIRSEIEIVKAFLSRSVDHYRAPYERASADYPRQCVLVGTTNSTEYLSDPTGNRRIWPIKCLSQGSIDKEWLAENRNQLWAEAAARELKNEPTWFSEDDLLEAAASHQQSRMYQDPWLPEVRRFLEEREAVIIPQVLAVGLNLPSQHQNKSAANRVGAILTQLGWVNKPVYDPETKKRDRKWCRNTTDSELCTP